MKKNFIYRLIFITVLLTTLTAVPLKGKASGVLNWSALPELPPLEGQAMQLGLAGAFSGIHNDALIIAGGANFPRPVWETNKVWHDDIYVLIKVGDSSQDEVTYRWITGFKFDKPIAYGSSVSTEHGVICIGGCEYEKTYSNVFILQWDAKKNEIVLPLSVRRFMLPVELRDWDLRVL
jgi:N-acetylneuraminic acid mutarotase